MAKANVDEFLKIVKLGCGDYAYDTINEEFSNLSARLKNKEITNEEFYEEFEVLKMAMKLVEE